MEDYYAFALTDPLRLFKENKSVCLNYKGVKHPSMILQNSILSLGKVYQEKNETTKDYAEKVKNWVTSAIDNLLLVF